MEVEFIYTEQKTKQEKEQTSSDTFNTVVKMQQNSEQR